MFNEEKFKSVFLSDCYNDLIRNYNKKLENSEESLWDYIIITASNELQAKAYNQQIQNRLDQNRILKTNYVVIPDYNDMRIGSGGSTLYVIKKMFEEYKIDNSKKILLVHSGGDSKRIPQFSSIGKLFSQVPKSNNDKNISTLFDELMILFENIPNQMNNGLVTTCGDALLMFNPLQLDFQYKETAIVTIKSNAEQGVNHGVTLVDENNFVKEFLHKENLEVLNNKGAVVDNKVNIDSGISFFSYDVLKQLYKLVSSEDGFKRYVNSEVRLNLYADFLTPLATNSTLNDYQKVIPENGFSEKLKLCRNELYNVLHNFKLYDIKAYPSSFIHFGTTKEFFELLTTKCSNYKYIGWTRNFNTYNLDNNISSYNSYIKNVKSSGTSLIINSSVQNCRIGKNVIINNSIIKEDVLDNWVLCTLKLLNGKYVTRCYPLNTNPKNKILEDKKIKKFFEINNLNINEYIDDVSIWEAKLFVTCNTIEDSCNSAIKFINMIETNNIEYFDKWINLEKESLESSYQKSDVTERLIDNQFDIEIMNLLNTIEKNKSLDDEVFKINNSNLKLLIIEWIKNNVDSYENIVKLRLYYILSQLDVVNQELYYNNVFDIIREMVMIDDNIKYYDFNIIKDKIEVHLPVRINFFGGWTDTPPYCIENGGIVLNGAYKLDGELPIYASIERTDDGKIVFECKDYDSVYEVKNIEELLKYNNPNDSFALIKSALFISSIVRKEDKELKNIIDRMGSGFKVTTYVKNIPRGSGLGTSSILSSALLTAIYKFCGKEITNEFIINEVLKLEQVMSTAGGWQDQIGGLVKGLKIIKSNKGKQNYIIDQINLSDDMKKTLSNRMLIINTGQRRLARNLLREIVLKYISNDKETLNVLSSIKKIAEKNVEYLENGDINNFAKSLTKHFNLIQKMDFGTTNLFIDTIFKAIDDMIIGKSIIGAGGGGFVLVITKENITIDDIKNRLAKVYYDTDIKVREVTLYEEA